MDFEDCLERYNRRMRIIGLNIRETKIKNSKELLDATFKDDASFTLGVYKWQLGKLQVKDYKEDQTIGIRLYKRKYSSANGITINFQTLYDTPISVGTIIFCSLPNEFWICTESFDIDGIHWEGKFTKCNWILKWQDKKTRKILEYPCFAINSTQYNSGESTNKLYTIGSSQHMIKLPCDENTVVLNTPQRFFLDKNVVKPTAYIVTQNDTTTQDGIVIVTVTEHPENGNTDRIDLGVCDYIEPDADDSQDENSDETSAKVSIIYDYAEIKSGGSYRTYIGKFFDENGNEIEDTLEWQVVCDFEEALEINIHDNQIEIGIDNDDYIDEEFKLILTDSQKQYSDSLIIRIGSLL